MNQQLPQMKSIWIDEDQEAEKLYSLQAQQLMGDDELNITLVNSDKPALNNKRQIDLRPLVKKSNSPQLYNRDYKFNCKSSMHSQIQEASNKVSYKKSIMNLFKNGNASGHSKKKKQQNNIRIISGPFDFQHISHAGGKHETTDELPQREIKAGKVDPIHSENNHKDTDSVKDSISLNKAFVTKTVRPDSEASSIYANSMKSNECHERIMSMSTTATTFLERTPSFHRIKHLSNHNNKSLNTQKPQLTTTERPSSTGSNISLTFLKNYNFPTLLEDEPIQDFNQIVTLKEEDEENGGGESTSNVLQPPTISLSSSYSITTSSSSFPSTADLPIKGHSNTRSISTTISNSSSTYSSLKPKSMHKRTSSVPGSLSTPDLEQFLFSDVAFKDRISVDDILRYYNTNNDGELITLKDADKVPTLDTEGSVYQHDYL